MADVIAFVFVFFFLAFLFPESSPSRRCQRYLIVYSDSGNRQEDLKETQNKVSRVEQRNLSIWSVSGPQNIVGVIAARFVFPLVVPEPQTLLPPLGAFLAQFVLLALLADLGLYWGHRIQHQNEWLWKHCHSVHHRLRTPSSWSTAYIEGRDSALQATLPLLLSGLIVRPHPITYSLYVAFHLGNNAWNHSGIDATWLNILSLKFLPFRCANTLHDAHHRFSGYGKGAKNFGEMFWLWDWVFGTLSNTSNLARHQKIDKE